MRELAGWELLLGGAVIIWVLWRFGRGSGQSLSRDEAVRPANDDDQADDDQTNNDWFGLLLPLAAVFLFVLLLIYSLRS